MDSSTATPYKPAQSPSGQLWVVIFNFWSQHPGLWGLPLLLLLAVAVAVGVLVLLWYYIPHPTWTWVLKGFVFYVYVTHNSKPPIT
jgi:hypothetical protein